MTCRELVELVTDYLEGALVPAERARFEMHLAHCRHCTAYLEQMRQTIRLTGRLRVDDIQPAAKAALLAAFRTWRWPT
ncbi:MAG: zf-HC2 domain-containing protein [Chloroflexi bacterium]|nr:zf-HC2 domain-containing protein [Chloroflexota bacterium]